MYTSPIIVMTFFSTFDTNNNNFRFHYFIFAGGSDDWAKGGAGIKYRYSFRKFLSFAKFSLLVKWALIDIYIFICYFDILGWIDSYFLDFLDDLYVLFG